MSTEDLEADTQPIRSVVAVAVALALILTPLAADRLSNIGWLGFGAGMVWTVLIVETVGALPTARALREGAY